MRQSLASVYVNNLFFSVINLTNTCTLVARQKR